MIKAHNLSVALIALLIMATLIASITTTVVSASETAMDVAPDHSIVKTSIQLEQYQGEMDVSPHALKPETKQEAEPGPKGFIYCPEIPLSKELQQHTYQRAIEKRIDYPILLALIWRESTFNPNAVGYNSNGTRDHGIMQINDCNVGWLYRDHGITNLMDPFQNITAGTEMLGKLVAAHGLHNGLMAYQYGEYGMINRVAAGFTTSSQTELLYTKGSEFRAMIDKYRTTSL